VQHHGGVRLQVRVVEPQQQRGKLVGAQRQFRRTQQPILGEQPLAEPGGVAELAPQELARVDRAAVRVDGLEQTVVSPP
jgi:hypothetical protein